MSGGSWLRFVVGLVLSVDVLRVGLTTRQIELSTLCLAGIFVLLSVLYVVGKF
jgi:hypothetical protein